MKTLIAPNPRADRLAGFFEPATVVLFAGLGGSCIGIEQAYVDGGFRDKYVDLCVNHWEVAVRVHELNHPMTQHLHADVWEVDPGKVLLGRKIAYLHASPDCFPAGTMVLTDAGYRPIESIKAGDRVLTHKLRWREVYKTYVSRKPLLKLRTHGHPGLMVSAEHPFYARQRSYTWDNDSRRDVATLGPEAWVTAGNLRAGSYRYTYPDGSRVLLDGGHYVASPTTFPAMEIPEVGGRGLAVDDRLMWLAGRYVGDGWTRLTDTRAELVITCGKHEVAKLRPLLNLWPREAGRAVGGELAWHERATKTAYQFATDHRGLVGWLRHNFGHRAEAKRLPAWSLGMDAPLRQALLAGYLSADGCNRGKTQSCSTVSKSLAYSVKGLAATLGHTAAVYETRGNTVIQGRKVNARRAYEVRWYHTVAGGREQTVRAGGLEWCPVRANTAIEQKTEVFNIAVEEDESYVVEGIVTHNCTDFSKAKGGMPKRKHIRALADVVLVWAGKRRPDVITLENVEEFLEWGPLMHKRHPQGRGRYAWIARRKGTDKPVETSIGPKVDSPKAGAFIEEMERAGWSVEPHLMPDPAQRGKEFNRWKAELQALGYVVEAKELRACDYGTPTTRKRLFVVARCDGKSIIWPEATHGKHASVRRNVDRNPERQPDQSHQQDGEWRDGVHGGRRQRRDHRARRERTAQGSPALDLDVERPGVGRVLTRYRTAAECIDWSQPMLSIFATRPEARRWAAANNVGRPKHDRLGVPQRPLQLKTNQRLAGGLLKHVLDAAEPFIVNIQNSKWGPDTYPVTGPLPTVTANPKGGAFAAVDVETAAFSVPRYGEREGQAPRSTSIDQPAPTVVSTGNGSNLVAVSLNKHFGGVIGQEAGEPIGTVTGVDHHSVLAAHLVRVAHGDRSASGNHRWGHVTHGLTETVPTVSASKDFGLAAVHVLKFRGKSPGTAADAPLDTITSGQGATRDAGAAHAMGTMCAYLSRLFGTNRGTNGDAAAPMGTVQATGKHTASVVVYLHKYFSSGGDSTQNCASVAEPMPAATGKDRIGSVAVESTPHWVFTQKGLSRAKQVARWAMKHLKKKIAKHLLWVTDEAGKRFALLMLALKGALHIVTDIAMRMLRPRELARAQGFADSYVIDRTVDGQWVSKADQVKLIGNSVCQQVMRAIAYANVVVHRVLEDAREAVPA